MSEMDAELSELLPFWVNGTLSGPEQARVAAALERSAPLRDEAAALAALRARMKTVPLAQGPGALGLARLMRAIEAEAPAAAVRRWPGMGVLAASVALAAVLSGAVTFAVMRGDEAVVYEQASGDDPAALVVTFRPDATEAAISALLREKGLVIVDGPSALGLYRLALPYDLGAEAAAEYLAAAEAVIATVEGAE